MRKLFIAGLATAFTGMGLEPGALASTISTADLMSCDGLFICDLANARIAGVPERLEGKSFNGQFGLGVKGNFDAGGSGEIDYLEEIRIAFKTPEIIEAFKIVFLYNGPEFGDFLEEGQIFVGYADGTFGSFTFGAVGENQATISSGLGDVTNCGPTTTSGAGCFLFSGRPLGDRLILSISFAGVLSDDSLRTISDFAIASINDATIPVPGAGILLLTGLGAAGAATRRRWLSSMLA